MWLYGRVLSIGTFFSRSTEQLSPKGLDFLDFPIIILQSFETGLRTFRVYFDVGKWSPKMHKICMYSLSHTMTIQTFRFWAAIHSSHSWNYDPFYSLLTCNRKQTVRRFADAEHNSPLSLRTCLFLGDRVMEGSHTYPNLGDHETRGDTS